MKTLSLLVAILGLTCLVGFVRQENGEPLAWHTNLVEASRMAGETGEPLLIVFR